MTVFRLILPLLILSVTLSGCAAPIVLAGAAAGAMVVSNDRRSAGRQLDDNAIELKVTGALSQDQELADNGNVNVTVFNGAVLMTGEAKRPELRGRAEELVRKSSAATKVYNEVVVGDPSPSSARANDAWVTTKVKSRLMTTKGLDGTRVKVVTEAGTVFLMGLVTRTEADTATSVVRETGGINRIVRVFEYVD